MIICLRKSHGGRRWKRNRKKSCRKARLDNDRDLMTGQQRRSCDAKNGYKKQMRKKLWLHEVWYDLKNQELNGMTANDALYLAYNSIIRELAGKGDCVFVMKCGLYIGKKD